LCRAERHLSLVREISRPGSSPYAALRRPATQRRTGRVVPSRIMGSQRRRDSRRTPASGVCAYTNCGVQRDCELACRQPDGTDHDWLVRLQRMFVRANRGCDDGRVLRTVATVMQPGTAWSSVPTRSRRDRRILPRFAAW